MVEDSKTEKGCQEGLVSREEGVPELRSVEKETQTVENDRSEGRDSVTLRNYDVRATIETKEMG